MPRERFPWDRLSLSQRSSVNDIIENAHHESTKSHHRSPQATHRLRIISTYKNSIVWTYKLTYYLRS